MQGLVIPFSSPACALIPCKRLWGGQGNAMKSNQSHLNEEFSFFERGGVDLELPSLAVWALVDPPGRDLPQGSKQGEGQPCS